MSDLDSAVNKANRALLITTMQRDIVGADGKGGSDGIVDADEQGIASIRSALTATAGVLTKARQAGLPIFYSAWGRPVNGTFANRHGPLFRWNNDSGMAIEGTRGHEFCDPVTPQPGELVLHCRTISAFAGSDLAARLTTSGIGTIVIAGIPTQWAVEGTVRDAADRGYKIVVLEDCCASGLTKRHAAAMDNIHHLASVTSSREFCETL